MNFLYPISPSAIVTQTFSEHVRRAQVNGWQNYYGGIDWAIPTGSQVKAAQTGTVQDVRTDATGYGTHVRIQHDRGYFTIYAHLQDFRVEPGQKVAAGEVIGRTDNTGNSTGPHLHFELRLNGIPIDPAPLLVTSLGDQPETPPPPLPEPGPEPATFPELPRVQVAATIGLNIRKSASTAQPRAGWLPYGTVVEVLRLEHDGGDTWGQIGHEQYIAIRYGGEALAVWEAE